MRMHLHISISLLWSQAFICLFLSLFRFSELQLQVCHRLDFSLWNENTWLNARDVIGPSTYVYNNHFSWRHMSSLERRLATGISSLPTFKLHPIYCQTIYLWLLMILRPTLRRRLERCRSFLELSIDLWSPRWLHGRHWVWGNEIANTFSIHNLTNPQHSGSEILRRMTSFAFWSKFPNSKFCWLRLFVNNNCLSLCLFGSMIRDRHTWICTVKKSSELENMDCHWSFRNARWWRIWSCSQFWCCFRNWILWKSKRLRVTLSLWQVSDLNKIEVYFIRTVQRILCWL